MKKTFPVLYKRTNTQATQYWKISVEDKLSGAIIKIEYGQIGTSSPQISTDLITSGKNHGKKNATTYIEQAYKESESRWKKQRKTGYFEKISDIDKQAYIKPMLANKFVDYQDKLTYPAIADKKYNGGRVISIAGGLFTRKGEEYKSIPHIYDTLKAFFKKYPDAVLDGEAYNHEYRYKLNEIMSLIRTTVKITPEKLKESKEKIKLYVYDGYGIDGTTEKSTLTERRAALKKALKGIEYIVTVEGDIVNSKEEFLKKYDEFVADGYEGAMYRVIDSPYEHKRSKYLLKLKPEDDDEAVITDIKEGTGSWVGTGKTVSLKWQDKEFDASFKGSIEQATQFLKDKKKWIGKKVTFIYFGFTGKGTPNFAQIDFNNCLKS